MWTSSRLATTRPRLWWIIDQGLESVHIKVALSGLEQRLKRIEDALDHSGNAIQRAADASEQASAAVVEIQPCLPRSSDGTAHRLTPTCRLTVDGKAGLLPFRGTITPDLRKKTVTAPRTPSVERIVVPGH